MRVLLLFLVATFFSTLTYAQSKVITGTVTDAKSGDPLPGVAVYLKNKKSVGAATDFDGKFTIKNVQSDNILVFSLLGYKNQEIRVGNNMLFNVQMAEETNELDEVVLIGYQKVNKAQVNGAVTSVKSEALQDIPVLNVADIISTQVPGLQSVSMSGAPAGRGALVIRGNTSMSTDLDPDMGYSTPLYVIDGIQTSLEDLAGYGVSNQDFLASLNPDDIESIDVLKDASAAAIYGSRGANGVIIIETKKGKESAKPEFTFSSSVGINPKPQLVKMYVGAAERNAKWAILNRWWSDTELQGQQSRMVMSDSLNPDFNNNVDYQGIFYRSGISRKYNLAVRGGSKTSTYRVGLGYDSQEGIIVGNSADRVTLSLNNTFKPSEGFTDNIVLRTSFLDQLTGQGNPAGGNYDLNSVLPVSPSSLQSSLFTYSDDRLKALKGQLDEKLNTDKTVSINMTNFATLRLIKGLNLNSRLSYVFNSSKKNFYEPSILRADGDGYASYAMYERNNFSTDTYFDFNKSFNSDNNLTFVVGNRTNYNRRESMRLSAKGYGSDAVKVINKRYTTDQITGSTGIDEDALVSFYGRASYELLKRYSVKFTYSIDGSSKFGEDVRWAKFPSVSAGWTLSREPFMKKILPAAVNYFKIRGSWGINGKQFDDNYRRFGAYDLGTGGIPHNSHLMDVRTYAGVLAVSPNYKRIKNENLSWEQAEQWNLGLNLALFDRRLNVEFEAYNKNTNRLFFDAIFPYYSGYDKAPANLGGVINYGWETLFRYSVFPSKNDFQLDLTLSFSDNRNFVSSLPNGNRGFSGTNYGYVVGRPLNLYKMLLFDYILDDLDQLPVNPYTGERLTGKGAWASIKPGFPIWKDLNGDYVLDEQDKTVLLDYSPQPKVQGAFNFNIKYKRWSLRAYTSFSFGATIRNGNITSYLDQYARAGGWVTKGLADLSQYTFWENPGDGAAGVDFPAIYANSSSVGGPYYSFRNDQTLWLDSGDYWRISNISLGYSFDPNEQFMKKVGLSSLRIFSTILNPYQWQRSNKVLDASMVRANGFTYGNGYPRSKTFSIGLNTQF
ncbi:SusC/RagA family TonB-linked outer membrane protein [Tenacibaculum sp. UWU-22]|uniref:SusC/RagA family TonB-linked outer membrane protein n=1 Tax=Tenacibaculum sp. UWU-22 TaxID=3234187 RepID=UPI0034DAE1DE